MDVNLLFIKYIIKFPFLIPNIIKIKYIKVMKKLTDIFKQFAQIIH